MGRWDNWNNDRVLDTMTEITTCSFLSDEKIEVIKQKRSVLMARVWEHFIAEKIVDPDRFHFSIPLINEIIAHYLDDVKAIKCRYKILDCIQLHKVAGLMTALIMRYRPIVPRKDVDKYVGEEDAYLNEQFAIFHGLAICGELSLPECEEMAQEDWFESWVLDFKYLLHARNYTPESLIFVFETISMLKFPKNFTELPKDK